MAVYGYARVSTTRQAAEGESLDVQTRQIRGYCTMQGWTVEGIHIDEGVSGALPLVERNAGRALLADLQPGDVVVAAKLDRVFRSALDALQMVENFKKQGVALHLIDLGGDVSGNGISKLFLTIVAAFAEAERDRIRERVQQTKADQRERNRFLGGRKPFGYRVSAEGELVEDEAEQRAIRKAKRMRRNGKSLRTIADALQAEGFRISHEGVSRVLGE